MNKLKRKMLTVLCFYLEHVANATSLTEFRWKLRKVNVSKRFFLYSFEKQSNGIFIQKADFRAPQFAQKRAPQENLISFGRKNKMRKTSCVDLSTRKEKKCFHRSICFSLNFWIWYRTWLWLLFFFSYKARALKLLYVELCKKREMYTQHV